MTDPTTFYRGAALSGTRFAVLGAYDSHSDPYFPDTQIAVFDINFGWEQITRKAFFGSGIARFLTGVDRAEAVVLSETGEVFFTQTPDTIEYVSEATMPAMSGPAVIDGRVFAVGAAGAHFGRDRAGDWRPLVEADYDPDFLGLSPVERAINVMGLETIEQYDAMSFEDEMLSFERVAERTRSFFAAGGSAVDDLYLVGAQGAVLHFDGTSYTSIDLAEASNLTRVVVHQNEIYVLGAHRGSVIYRGTIFQGFERIFKEANQTVYIDGLAFLGDRMFLSDPQETTGGLYELEGASLIKHNAIEGPVWAIDAIDGVLWVMQAKALHRFDGTTWEKFDSPYL